MDGKQAAATRGRKRPRLLSLRHFHHHPHLALGDHQATKPVDQVSAASNTFTFTIANSFRSKDVVVIIAIIAE
jgi:hypothetical protein